MSSSRLVPASLALWLQPFREGFTAPTWEHVLVLIVGGILTPGRRTVAAALRVVGFEQAMDFANYHRVLNRNRWSSRWVARCLFRVLVNNLVPTGPVIMGLDDTIERRWGDQRRLLRCVNGQSPAEGRPHNQPDWCRPVTPSSHPAYRPACVASGDGLGRCARALRRRCVSGSCWRGGGAYAVWGDGCARTVRWNRLVCSTRLPTVGGQNSTSFATSAGSTAECTTS